MEIPAGFIEEIGKIEGIDHEAFYEALSGDPSVSIRINRRKCYDVTDLGYPLDGDVPWSVGGYYLSERPKFTFNPLLHAGVFYVQDASSMVYGRIVEKLVSEIGENPLTVADLCAAPGGKTTAMIDVLPEGSVVLANEFTPQRAPILRENLIKWGYPDVVVTSGVVSRLAAIGDRFDIVAVDAPCSGEGMMRKEATAVSQWSEGLVRQCAALQREILDDAVRMLREGGYLIYSTCTFNTAEDEENLRYLVDELSMEPVDTGMAGLGGIMPQVEGDYPALRFMPHSTRGEGLFVGVVRKPGEYVPQQPDRGTITKRIGKGVKILLDGIPQTVVKGREQVPAPESAFRTDFDAEIPRVEVDEATAIAYLRHEAVVLPPEAPRGYVAITYKKYRLGLAKNLGNRANNLYPKEWRIRSRV